MTNVYFIRVVTTDYKSFDGVRTLRDVVSVHLSKERAIYKMKVTALDELRLLGSLSAEFSNGDVSFRVSKLEKDENGNSDVVFSKFYYISEEPLFD